MTNKIFLEIMSGYKIWLKNTNLHIQDAVQKTKQDKLKSTPRYIIITLLEAETKKNLESSRRDNNFAHRGKEFKYQWISHQKPRTQRQYFSSTEFCIWWNYTSGKKGKERHSQRRENREFVASRPTLKEQLKEVLGQKRNDIRRKLETLQR